MNLRDTIAHRLHELCAGEDGAVNQSALARASGISQGAVGKIVKAKVDPTVGTVEALAAGLGLDSAALLLTAREWALMADYRALDDSARVELANNARKLRKALEPVVSYDIDLTIPCEDDRRAAAAVGLSRPERPRRVVTKLKVATVNGSHE